MLQTVLTDLALNFVKIPQQAGFLKRKLKRILERCLDSVDSFSFEFALFRSTIVHQQLLERPNRLASMRRLQDYQRSSQR